jgi:hypothetical protein
LQVVALEVAGVVTVREAVAVPGMPVITVPERYRVPMPQGLMGGRHPIYGTNLGKTKTEDCTEEPKKKKSKKSKKTAVEEPIIELQPVKSEPNEEPVKKKKKKKKEEKE